MLPEAKTHDLLYVSTDNEPNASVNVYELPNEKLVGTLTGFLHAVGGQCVDSASDVFIGSWPDGSYGSGTIYEYAHGGTSPIATLDAPGPVYNCSVDQTTGNLAVVGPNLNNPHANYGSLAIYIGAKGTPKVFYSSTFSMNGCSYDDKGNLYLSVYSVRAEEYGLARLATGSSSIKAIDLETPVYAGMYFNPSVRWNGRHMTVSSFPANDERGESGPISVYQLKFSGAHAAVIATTRLNSPKNFNRSPYWIAGKYAAGIYNYRGYGRVGLWSYPQGGTPVRGVKVTDAGTLPGLTISVAPH
ncbi:MAG TPA: hypothetical protein VGG51_06535 [Candidatus Cybelea sp.]|jgi:hypothetical protein